VQRKWQKQTRDRLRNESFMLNMIIKGYGRVGNWIEPVEGTRKGETGLYEEKDGKQEFPPHEEAPPEKALDHLPLHTSLHLLPLHRLLLHNRCFSSPLVVSSSTYSI
jgi:hypothetical protein